jgi:ketopantoate reductase
MNGIEASSKLKEIFPSAIFIDTVIYSLTKFNENYSASQKGKFAHICIVSKEKDEMRQNSAENFWFLLKSFGFDLRFSKSIESDIWQKFIHKCAINSIKARYLYKSGQLRKDEKCLKDLKSIYSERYNVAKALWKSMPEDYVETKLLLQ